MNLLVVDGHPFQTLILLYTHGMHYYAISITLTTLSVGGVGAADAQRLDVNVLIIPTHPPKEINSNLRVQKNENRKKISEYATNTENERTP